LRSRSPRLRSSGGETAGRFLFLLTVLVGMEAITLGVKDLVGGFDRRSSRRAASLGRRSQRASPRPQPRSTPRPPDHRARTFPQRVRQLVVAAQPLRSRSRSRRSRVLLDLHWLSDVIGGLSLGWAWFALCSVVFGGRLLIPTAGVDVAAAEAAAPSRSKKLTDPRGAGEQPTASNRRQVRHV
jgi:hypothetical protein